MPCPPNANFSLISRLKQVLSNGVPILILRAHQPAVAGEAKLRAGNFDYFAYIQSLAVRSNQITIQDLDGTDHSFANSDGRLAVWQHTEKWLSELFPPATAPSPLFGNQGFQVSRKENRSSSVLGFPLLLRLESKQFPPPGCTFG